MAAIDAIDACRGKNRRREAIFFDSLCGRKGFVFKAKII
jgi:hypothetical protein